MSTGILDSQIEAAKNKVKELEEKKRRFLEKKYLTMGKFIEKVEKGGWQVSIEEIQNEWSRLNK
jgi:hypothetical protein